MALPCSLVRSALFVLVVLLLAACGGSSDDAADTTATTTTIEATTTTTTTVAPTTTTTAAPTTTTVVESSDPTGTDTGNESDLPPEAAAIVDAYFEAINSQDSEAFGAVINPAVYEYVFSGTSFSADGLLTGIPEEFALERYAEISVQLEHTFSNTAYVAISAVRPYTEPTPVNGMMVLELIEFPDQGWLITKDYRFGL